MIRNLFSIFDPTTEINSLPLNWTRTAIGLLLIPTRIWLIPTRYNIIVSLLINKLHQEIKTILRRGNENKGNSFILTSLFTLSHSRIKLICTLHYTNSARRTTQKVQFIFIREINGWMSCREIMGVCWRNRKICKKTQWAKCGSLLLNRAVE
jgi:hypothetical protein